VPTPANHRDDGLLAATLDAITVVGPLSERPVVHLDAGYDYQPCRQVLAERGMAGEIATRGIPAPIQAGRRWVIERTHAWGNQYGKLRWCTERRRLVVECWLALANAAIVCGRLVRRTGRQIHSEGTSAGQCLGQTAPRPPRSGSSQSMFAAKSGIARSCRTAQPWRSRGRGGGRCAARRRCRATRPGCRRWVGTAAANQLRPWLPVRAGQPGEGRLGRPAREPTDGRQS
jgi:hypothetical protein